MEKNENFTEAKYSEAYEQLFGDIAALNGGTPEMAGYDGTIYENELDFKGLIADSVNIANHSLLVELEMTDELAKEITERTGYNVLKEGDFPICEAYAELRLDGAFCISMQAYESEESYPHYPDHNFVVPVSEKEIENFHTELLNYAVANETKLEEIMQTDSPFANIEQFIREDVKAAFTDSVQYAVGINEIAVDKDKFIDSEGKYLTVNTDSVSLKFKATEEEELEIAYRVYQDYGKESSGLLETEEGILLRDFLEGDIQRNEVEIQAIANLKADKDISVDFQIGKTREDGEIIKGTFFDVPLTEKEMKAFLELGNEVVKEKDEQRRDVSAIIKDVELDFSNSITYNDEVNISEGKGFNYSIDLSDKMFVNLANRIDLWNGELEGMKFKDFFENDDVQFWAFAEYSRNSVELFLQVDDYSEGNHNIYESIPLTQSEKATLIKEAEQELAKEGLSYDVLVAEGLSYEIDVDVVSGGAENLIIGKGTQQISLIGDYDIGAYEILINPYKQTHNMEESMYDIVTDLVEKNILVQKEDRVLDDGTQYPAFLVNPEVVMVHLDTMEAEDGLTIPSKFREEKEEAQKEFDFLSSNLHRLQEVRENVPEFITQKPEPYIESFNAFDKNAENVGVTYNISEAFKRENESLLTDIRHPVNFPDTVTIHKDGDVSASKDGENITLSSSEQKFWTKEIHSFEESKGTTLESAFELAESLSAESKTEKPSDSNKAEKKAKPKNKVDIDLD